MTTVNLCAGRRIASGPDGTCGAGVPPVEPQARGSGHGRAPSRVLLLRALVVLFLLPTAGCIQFAALWANISGGDIIEPEYTLTRGPLLVLIDDRDSLVTEPHAIRQLHGTISSIFLEYNVNRRVVPFENWQTLQRSAKDYNRLSIREIGEKLGADQVLYLRVERFTLHEEPGAPLFKGQFAVRLKVLSTEAKREVRLWPRDEKGKRIVATTDPTPSDGGKSAGDVAKELATNLADVVSKLFYEHRELDK